MPRLRLSLIPIALGGIAFVALTARVGLADQSSAPSPNGAGAAPAPAQPTAPVTTNPLADFSGKITSAPAMPDSTGFQDYRKNVDPDLQRHQQSDATKLPLFGYTYFEPAREIILARRAYFRDTLPQIQVNNIQQQKPVPGQGPSDVNGAKDQPSSEDMAAVAALTDAQKLDLLLRQRDGKLTPDEARRYRAFLFPDAPGPRIAAGNGSAINGGTVNMASGQYGIPRQMGFGNGYGLASEPGNDQSNPANRPESLDAYRAVSDPISQLYENVAASVPTDYQLAAGDSLTLRYWSPTLEAQEKTLVLDPTGGVTIPEVGRVILRGQTASQAEGTLRERLRRFYRNVEVSVSLKELRTIPVTLSGESFAPGTYTVPAVVTAMNMLYATGGPTDAGTLRRIEVRRRGALVGTMDFYKFLLTGDKTSDIPLQSGDVIYIPGSQTRVNVRGEVHKPAVYELVDGETLADALRYAGGIRASGVNQRVQISTLRPGAERVLKDVDATTSSSARQVSLYDGDAVDVFSVRNTLMNKVSVEGAVDQPGEYAIMPGMTVADLIDRARGLTSEAYPTLGHLYRYNPDSTLTLIPIDLEKALARDPAANVKLDRWDKLTVYTRQDVAWTGRREVTVRGAVKKAGIYYRSENMHVKDLLLQAGGTLPEAYTERAVLLHQKPDGSFSYDYVNLGDVLKGSVKDDLPLQDRDVLAIYRTDEARFTPEHTVSIQGEVVAPGSYPRGENMRLSDAIKLAGGLTPKAGEKIVIAHARADEGSDTMSATFSTASSLPTPDPVLQDGDLISIQGRGVYQERPFVVTVTGAVNSPGPVVLRGPKATLSEVIASAGGLKPEAYPEGAEFARSPVMLATDNQKSIAGVVSKLNDLLNQSEYKRELAKSDIERIKALGSATRSAIPMSIPGVTPTPDIGTAAAGTSAGAAALFTHDIVSTPRTLADGDLQPKGNVAVNLADALKHPEGPDDIVMLDGDSVHVPEKPTTVEVVGAVMHGRGVFYRVGSNLDYYVAQAGGYAPDAAKDRVLVIRLGGGLTPIKKLKTINPGDVILVPTQVLASRIANKSNDIDTIFRSLTNSALVVLVAKKLIGL